MGHLVSVPDGLLPLLIAKRTENQSKVHRRILLRIFAQKICIK